MALYTQQTLDGFWRFELLPNRSSSWTQTGRFLIVIALFNGVIALLFAWQCLWLVAPFSGFEVFALGAGLYCCSRASCRRELILAEEERVLVLRGRGRIEARDEFAQGWVRLQ